LNLLFAWRYFKAKKSTNAINIIAWVSVLAMAVGTAALIILLSVFNGFESLVKSLYSDFYTDIQVKPANGKTFTLSAAQQQKIAVLPGVKAMSMTLEEKALLQNGDYRAIVSVKGVDEHFPQVSNVSKRLIRGKFLLGDADKPALVMGVGVENTIGVASDRAILPLTVYLPRRGASTSELTDPLQSLSADNAAAAGAFAIQQDFDNNYVITNLGFVKRMMGLDSNEYGAADISVDNTEASVQVKKELEQLLGKQYKVQTMYEQNQSLYSAMRGEKWFIFVVLTFVLVVAAFTMIGALTMLVLEKQKDIQILKAMGSTNSRVQGIFLNEGLVLGVIGSAGGVLLALLIGWLQLKFKLIKLEGSTFLIDHYPVKFLASDILLVFFTVICIALLASWFPARKAAAEPMTLKSS